MPEDRGVPTDEYVEAVMSAVEDKSDFSDELAELLATNCWRHDWPFDKSFQSKSPRKTATHPMAATHQIPI